MRETGDEESPAERQKAQAKVSGSEGYRCVWWPCPCCFAAHATTVRYQGAEL